MKDRIFDRLISADVFKREIEELAEYANFDIRDLHFSTADVISNIEFQKTVDAIPVSYILAKVKTLPDSVAQETLIALVNQWLADKKERKQ